MATHICILLNAGECDAVVPVVVIILEEVLTNGAQEYENVVELFEQEEARCHALAAWDSIALTSRGADQLKVLLRVLQVLRVICRLTQNSVNDTFQDVLLQHSSDWFSTGTLFSPSQKSFILSYKPFFTGNFD